MARRPAVMASIRFARRVTAGTPCALRLGGPKWPACPSWLCGRHGVPGYDSTSPSSVEPGSDLHGPAPAFAAL
eukprot:8227032-Alexandrium_andersonii.AAC.1